MLSYIDRATGQLKVNGFAPIRLDVASSTIMYLGEAVVGSLTSDSVWKIQRITSDTTGSLYIEFADGNINYDNVWDNRASLSYS